LWLLLWLLLLLLWLLLLFRQNEKTKAATCSFLAHSLARSRDNGAGSTKYPQKKPFFGLRHQQGCCVVLVEVVVLLLLLLRVTLAAVALAVTSINQSNKANGWMDGWMDG